MKCLLSPMSATPAGKQVDGWAEFISQMCPSYADCIYTYLRSEHYASQATARCGQADLITVIAF